MKFFFISNDEIMQADFPLSIAIKHHNVEMVKLLLSHGADLDCCIVIDEEYQARLQYICTHYNSPSVEVPYRDMIYIAKKYGTPEILALIKSKRDKE